jgi:hypothetical protein
MPMSFVGGTVMVGQEHIQTFNATDPTPWTITDRPGVTAITSVHYGAAFVPLAGNFTVPVGGNSVTPLAAVPAGVTKVHVGYLAP